MLTNKRKQKERSINTFERTEENLETLYQSIEKIKLYKIEIYNNNGSSSNSNNNSGNNRGKENQFSLDKVNLNLNDDNMNKLPPIPIPNNTNNMPKTSKISKPITSFTPPYTDTYMHTDIPKIRKSFIENLRQMVYINNNSNISNNTNIPSKTSNILIHKNIPNLNLKSIK